MGHYVPVMLVILRAFWIMGVLRYSNAVSSLFDVETDPYEANDISGVAANAAVLASLQQRLEYFASLNGVADLQSTSGNGLIFSEAGGVVPWLDYDTLPTRVNRSGTASEGAPNLVFILLDDVGWNDVSTLNFESTYMVPTPNIHKLASIGIELVHHYTAWYAHSNLDFCARLFFISGFVILLAHH